eukprot:4253631-Amphidinium_carterae.1
MVVPICVCFDLSGGAECIFCEPCKLPKDGNVGKANRGQRGIDNLMEYMPLYLAMFFAAGYVFPFPMFINACAFCASRIVYAMTYVQNKDARFSGFMPFVICKSNAEGMVLLIFIKTLLS